MPSKLNTVIDEVKEDLDKASKLALLATVTEARAFSITPTSNTQPPARKGEGRRKAYSGLWADVTSVLRNSKKIDPPKKQGLDLIASIYTDIEYAAHLDGKKRKEGGRYYVLTGLDKDFDFQEAYLKNLKL
jgi:hypothetical protein